MERVPFNPVAPERFKFFNRGRYSIRQHRNVSNLSLAIGTLTTNPKLVSVKDGGACDSIFHNLKPWAPVAPSGCRDAAAQA